MEPKADPDFLPAPDLTPAQARAIRRRLLERLAEDDESHVTVHAEQGEWQPFLDGVALKVLHEAAPVMSYLLRLDPGASVPAHRHRLAEECVVLSGTLRIGSHIEVCAGGYHLAHAGALHALLHTETGATVFLRGAIPEPGDVLA